MSDYDRNYAARGFGAAQSAAIDAGLRAYMLRVYNYMAAGVALTGVVAYFAFQAAGGDAIRLVPGGIVGATAFGQMILGGFTPILLMLVTLGLVFFLSYRISSLQPSTAFGVFMLYAALLGLALTPIFVVYTGASVSRTFFISAASFGALSLYGYTTQRDLSPIGSFLIMGVFGILLASLVNIWLGSHGLAFAISVIGVLVFAGLTAYDTQRIKEMYSSYDDGTVAGRKAVMGALSLYLDFINLFLFLLRFMGDRR
ncbi:MAG TPA: Bax inhibitor-1/YccA family protein [Pseudolabrys sp.]|jgi:FtsH-binding integral membrane protein|nr:Bax inhibitor-1/YccA family protein [Pseudolabrys sp.]